MAADSTTILVGHERVAFQRAGSRDVIEVVGPSQDPRPRPFLKWAGGKQWLTALARAWAPKDFDGVYFEPFVGGAAAFFALAPEKAVLSDRCHELMTAYRALQEDPEPVISSLRRYPHSKSFYKQIRRRKPRKLHTQAARIIYLNKTAFNGLYRVNQGGEFNVPFGRYSNPRICNEDRLRAAAAALKGVSLKTADFEEAVADAEAGDLVYLDPPYITGHQNNGFLKYNAPLFAWGDQERLSRLACELRDSGVTVLVSNSDHAKVTSLYHGFHHYRLHRNSLIGGLGSSRGLIGEALLSSVPLLGVSTAQIDG